ncbi:MAG: hypothetical protein EAY72_01305 [Bacteroidetes bacterium]|nr:MAG: hypothetical protein EAY72_01305 [Bacteroidota bacterium]
MNSSINKGIHVFKQKRWLRVVLYSVLTLLLLVFILSIVVYSNKKAIIQYCTNYVNVNYQANLQVADVGIAFLQYFPHAGIDLKQVRLAGKNEAIALLVADEISVRIKYTDVLFGRFPLEKLQVKNGTIQAYTDTSGKTNFSFLSQPDSSKKQESKTAIPAIQAALKNVAIEIKNDAQRKHFHWQVQLLTAKVTHPNDALQIKLQFQLTSKAMAFNTKHGSFLENATIQAAPTIQYIPGTKTYKIDSTQWLISDIPFTIAANITDTGNQHLQLYIHTPKVNTMQVKALVTPKIARSINKVQCSGTLWAKAVLNTPLRKAQGDPEINVDFGGTGTVLEGFQTQLKNADFIANFNNAMNKAEPTSDANSSITIHQLTALYQTLPFSVKNCSIENLDSPFITTKIAIETSVKNLQAFVPNHILQFDSGKIIAQLDYSARIGHNLFQNAVVNGAVTIQDIHLFFPTYHYALKKGVGTIQFQGTNVWLPKLSFTGGSGNHIHLSASAPQLLTTLAHEQAVPNFSIQLAANALNINQWKQFAVPKTTGKKQSLSALAYSIDKILNHGKLSFHASIQQLYYQNMVAKNCEAEVVLSAKNCLIKNVSMNVFGGRIQATGASTVRGNIAQITTQVKATNIAIPAVFKGFDNFGMQHLQHKQLNGTANANIRLQAYINSKGIQWKTVHGKTNVQLTNLQLLNYEPLTAIKRKIFKNRSLENVVIPSLQRQFIIQSGLVQVPETLVSSNVFFCQLSGKVGLGNLPTNLLVKIPLKNLSKKNSEERLLQAKSKTGMSIFFRAATDPQGKLDIHYLPFKF